MKKQLLRFALYPIITYFICGTLNPAVAASQPSVGRGTHFCGVIDYPSNRQHSDQYPNRRYARTAAANLDVGEPRTVRMIYFLPNDRPYRADVVQKMKDEIRTVQNFFADQMGAHGYGNKTFRLETDSQGTPLVHRVDGQYPDSHYLYRTEDTVFAEIERKFDVMQNIYSIVIDNSINEIRWGEGRRAIGFGGRRGKNGGLVLHSGEFGWQTLAHHMGHGFGLWHDFSDGAYIMSYGPGWNRLSPYYTEYLSVHPYFNPEIPLEAGQTSTMEFISPRTYPAGSENVSIRLKVSDSEGLYQVLLLLRTGLGHPGAGSIEVKAGRGFMGEKDAIVEFDYDGVTPSDKFTSLSNPAAHRIHVQTVDTAGNVSQEYFVLAEISPYHIASLEGHTGAVHSMSFSSDGKTLASGAYDNMVKLWNVELGTNIAIFPGGRSMSFSSDGTTLASAWKDTVKLWDVTTQQVIATLSHTSFVHSVSFSSNGGMLASGLEDGTVQLWDVEKKENTATLEGHTDRVHSVSFSADGTLLVSGSDDNRIKLWDIKTKENITTLEGHTAGFHSVVFSPDGRTLASGSSNRTVKLWDVATGSNFATLEGHLSWISSVSFSADGVILASAGGWDNTINLWDVTTGASFATLGYTSGFHSVSFSDDGRILAAGTKEGTVKLWDTSGWLEARLEVVVEIDIPDSDLRAAIATALGAPVGVSILRGHLENLTRLEAPEAGISDLTGLEYATNLTYLDFWKSSVSDLSPVEALTKLTHLGFAANNVISDISALAGLTNLTALWVNGNNISDISPLAGLTKLSRLGLDNNNISDISPLANLTKLSRLELDNNNISDISALAGLTNLSLLNLRSNSILDISPLANLTNLTELSLDFNNITDISVLAGLPNLIDLALGYNAITDHSILSGLTNLIELDLRGTNASDLSVLSGLTNLTRLYIDSNGILDLSPLAGLTNLTNIGLNFNSISDLSVLRGLTNLSWMRLVGNNIADLSPLVANRGLGDGDQVLLNDNPLSYLSIKTHIPILQSRGVTVEFDNQAHPAILKISGDNQNGASFAPLPQPFVIEAQDANGSALIGISVTFAVTLGGGTLSTTITRTDENGRAQSTLTLGPNLGTNTVQVSAAGIGSPVTFYAISDTESPPITADVNGDGSVNILDLVVIASDLGNQGQNLAADVSGDGVVNILDLILVAGMFDGAAAAPSAQPHVPETLTAVEVQQWLIDARSLEAKDPIMKRGFVVLEQLLVSLTPTETELLPNYPNPFNPETWIPYRLAEDAFVTLTIYDGSGRVIRTLDVGHRIAAVYESRSKAIYWDGRNGLGEQVASGVYFYTLTAGDYSNTRKMVILK